MIWIDGFPMDLAKREEYSFESEATEHPIERGADVTDHVRARPIEITLECVVSDSPLDDIASDTTRQAEGADIPIPSEEAYARLLAIRDARQPVTIETGLATFESMVLLSLSVPRDASTSGGLFFEASFRQVRIVENRRVTVRVAVPIAKGKTNLGNKKGKESKQVPRRVDAANGEWFDPDINAWREGASFNPQTKSWEYYKGKPVGDYPRGLTDAQYRELIAAQRDGALPSVDKAAVPGVNAGQQIQILNVDQY